MIKNGKLFGKINVIDLLVLLVVLVAVAAVALFVLKPADAGDTLIVRYMIEEVDDFVADRVELGDDLYDDSYSVALGKVIDIDKDQSLLGARDGYCSLIITGECSGTKTNFGAEIAGRQYGVGHSFVLRAGDAKFYLRVYDIDVKDENYVEPVEREDQEVIIMKYMIEEVDDFVAEKVHVGDELYDDTYTNGLGIVTDVDISESLSYGGMTDGVYTLGSKEGYCSMIITGECMGTKTSLGAEIAGKKYGVGHTFVLRAGDAKLYLRVYDIQVKDENYKAEGEDATDQLTEVKYTLYAYETDNFVAQAIKVGDRIKNTDKNCEAGVVESIVIGPSESYYESNEGIKVGSKENYSSVTLECSAMGRITEEGIEIDGKLYSIGDGFSARLGNTRIYLKIRAIG